MKKARTKTQAGRDALCISNSFCILSIGKKLNSFRFKKRRFRRQRAGALVFLRELSRDDFARFDVWLIERIDADNGSRDCRGDLPAEKFLTQIVNIRDRNGN